MDIVTLALAKKYVQATLAGVGALSGKSAYDIAVENGFQGTAEEWLNSLKGLPGSTPSINPTTLHWEINGLDTGIAAQISDYTLLINKPIINGIELTGQTEVQLTDIGIEPASDSDINNLF